MANRPGLRVRTNGIDNVLSADRSLLLGRDAAADVRYEDQRVSRRHAVLRFDGVHWRLEDLGSSNGTYLGDTRVSAHVVTGPARLRLGSPIDGPELDVAPVGVDPEPVPAVPAPLPPAVVPAEQTHSLPAALAGSTGRAAAVDLGTRVAVHPLSSGLVRIGRGPGNEIVLADPHVSRDHAELRWDPRGGWQVTDLNSHNGTYVNGHRISTAPLREGDVLTVGRRHLRLVPGALEEHESGDVRLDAVDLSVHTSEGRALLRHVSLSVEKGAFVGVVGPSGAGKTTLLNALTGFKPADEGSVFYGGRNLYAEYEELRRRIGYVPQDDIVHAQLTVRAALGYAAELRFPRDVPKTERDQRVAEVIRELGLAERADLVIEKLSGGQRKRVNIAVELLTKPSPLFLDEPTSGLDPGLERGMMTLLRDLAKGGRTVIVVTHAVQSLSLCDRVLMLAPGGRVAFYGPPNAALGYFGRTDFVDVFQDLEASPDAPWDQRFWASR
ncbi:MAG: FHA domain-containing protein, partial [Candidatus Dormiibacterota bacterium]